MMTCSDRNPVVIENRSDVVGMDPLKDKRNNTSFVLRGSNDLQALHAGERICCIFEEIVLMAHERFEIETAEVIERRAETYAAGDVR